MLLASDATGASARSTWAGFSRALWRKVARQGPSHVVFNLAATLAMEVTTHAGHLCGRQLCTHHRCRPDAAPYASPARMLDWLMLTATMAQDEPGSPEIGLQPQKARWGSVLWALDYDMKLFFVVSAANLARRALAWT